MQDDENIFIILEFVPGGELSNTCKSVQISPFFRRESPRNRNSMETSLMQEVYEATLRCRIHFSLSSSLIEIASLRICFGRTSKKSQNYRFWSGFGRATPLSLPKVTREPSGQKLASPVYGPEVWDGHVYDARLADVWSMGVILYPLVVVLRTNASRKEILRFNTTISGKIASLLHPQSFTGYSLMLLLICYNVCFSREIRITIRADMLRHPFLM